MDEDDSQERERERPRWEDETGRTRAIRELRQELDHRRKGSTLRMVATGLSPIITIGGIVTMLTQLGLCSPKELTPFARREQVAADIKVEVDKIDTRIQSVEQKIDSSRVEILGELRKRRR